MRYRYDNSTNNPLNPNNPPVRIKYGPQSNDEMAELWFQLVVKKASGRGRLAAAYASKSQKVFGDLAGKLLRENPDDAEGHLTLGLLFAMRGDWNRSIDHYRRAIASQPELEKAHFNLGVALISARRLPEAKTAFESAIRLDPENNRAIGSLGIVHLELGHLDEAAALFEKAIRLNPDDAIARGNLEMAL